jgi:hypothetical protein
MLEAQAYRIDEREFWSMKPMLLPGDAGAMADGAILSERPRVAAVIRR